MQHVLVSWRYHQMLLSQLVPRLWPFLWHNITSVRRATLKTLSTLLSKSSEQVSFSFNLTEYLILSVWPHCYLTGIVDSFWLARWCLANLLAGLPLTYWLGNQSAREPDHQRANNTWMYVHWSCSACSVSLILSPVCVKISFHWLSKLENCVDYLINYEFFIL